MKGINKKEVMVESRYKFKSKSDYSRLSKEQVLEELNTSSNGLLVNEVEKRIHQYGLNQTINKKKKHLLFRFLMKFFNPLILLLIVITIFSLIYSEKASAILIVSVILISVIIDFFQEHNFEKAIEKLNEIVKTKVNVIRNGKRKEIDVKNLVPGDIVELFAGDMVPADIRLISSNDLYVNQSSLTGESFPIRKIVEPIDKITNNVTELKNLVFMGSSIVSGNGIGVVYATGITSEFGEISKSLAKERPPTSFDKGINKFTLLMIKLILLLVVGIFGIIMVVKRGSFKDALLFSLAVAVGLAPELLPMIVTINLSKGATKMATKKVIVKHLNSIQNFGAMDILCTDKTGTLTQDKVILQKHCDIDGNEDNEVLKMVYINSYFQTGLKNLLEKAILEHEKIDIKDYKKVDEIPFDFSRKMLSVVVENKIKNNEQLLVSKGAPEEIFKRCSHYEINGKVVKLDNKTFSNLKKEYEKLSKEGFIVLAIAYRKFIQKKGKYSVNDENLLILKGYAAFLDPAKPRVKQAIDLLEAHGIEVKILTGDNELITQKICKDVDIKIKGILTGDLIDNMDDIKLKLAVEDNTIFARMNPQQKERVILALKSNNHVVGYLGDGINDAPSLRAADVGITVNNAVDVAKESADIVLLEKSLIVLNVGVIEGRKTFGNIIKYIKMSASSNFGNMFSISGATLFLPFLPMLPVQILFNNFLYDLSQITIPSDDVDKEYLKNPHDWNVGFIKRFIIFIGPLSSIYDFITFGILIFVFKANEALFHTGWFIESLCTQVLVIYVIRTNKIPFIQSRPSKALVFSTLGIIALAIIVPFTKLGTYLGFVNLPPLYFGILFILIFTYLLLVQLVKTWLVRKYGFQ